MGVSMHISKCQKKSYAPEVLYSTDSNFNDRMRWLKNQGYTVQSCFDINYQCKKFVMAKPNAVIAEIVDASGFVYHDIDLHDAIMRYYTVQRVHDNRIREFIEGVNNGTINMAIDCYAKAYVIK